MASLNEVNLIGNLTRDIEVRTTQAGKKIVTMTVATNETWKDANGERKEKSEFHQVVIFNEGLAGVAERYLKKGSRVYLRGALQTRRWQDAQGHNKYSTECVLQGYDAKLVLLGEPRGERDVKQAAAGALLEHGDTLPYPDEDLPF